MNLTGIDLNSLPVQFERKVPGRTLLLDGDGFCYAAAGTAKTLPTAIRRFIKSVMEQMFLTNSTYVRIHLTSKGSKKAHRERYPTVKPYQGNREGKAKPPLLEPLRNAIAHHASVEDGVIPEDWFVDLHHYWEADDGLIMDSWHYRENGVILSPDKDMRLCIGPYYDMESGRVDYIDNAYGWIGEKYTPAGQLKATGHGTKFFWQQLLEGDTADNVKGITKLNGKLCGTRGALDFLQPIQDENEAANRIIWEYARSEQMFLSEAECLWLRRSVDDSAYTYISSLDLDKPLRAWLEQLHQYHTQLFEEYGDEQAFSEDS